MRSLLTLIALGVLVLALPACKSGDKTEPTTAPASQASMGVLNDTCPVMGEPVGDDPVTVAYGDYSIGFCCGGCVGKWEKMSDDEKAAFVAQYTH